MSHVSLRIRDGIEAWETLEERPTGSREKVTVAEPGTGALSIFKRPKEGREHQTWSELAGSFIAGDMLGWPVQRTGLGLRRGQPGNLLAYFFDPDGGERLVEGWRLCRDAKPDFDDRVGTDHSLALLEQVADTGLDRYGISREAFFDFWARAIAFDTLISNTDRHAENWGIVESAAGNRIAPLYDNATSLGCGIDGKGLARHVGTGGIVAEQIARFTARGRHHLRIDGQAKRGTPFTDICSAFLAAHPNRAGPFRQVADLDLKPAMTLFDDLAETAFPEAGRNHAAGRAEHMYAILVAGQARVREALRN